MGTDWGCSAIVGLIFIVGLGKWRRFGEGEENGRISGREIDDDSFLGSGEIGLRQGLGPICDPS